MNNEDATNCLEKLVKEVDYELQPYQSLALEHINANTGELLQRLETEQDFYDVILSTMTLHTQKRVTDGGYVTGYDPMGVQGLPVDDRTDRHEFFQESRGYALRRLYVCLPEVYKKRFESASLRILQNLEIVSVAELSTCISNSWPAGHRSKHRHLTEINLADIREALLVPINNMVLYNKIFNGKIKHVGGLNYTAKNAEFYRQFELLDHFILPYADVLGIGDGQVEMLFRNEDFVPIAFDWFMKKNNIRICEKYLPLIEELASRHETEYVSKKPDERSFAACFAHVLLTKYRKTKLT